MKQFLLLWMTVAIVLSVPAQDRTSNNIANGTLLSETHVTATEALNIGYVFMRTGNGTRGSNVSKQNMQLIYTGRAIDSVTQSITDCYYVFALQPKGFVIVAADERVEPILGYSYDNDFAVANMPDHVRRWLDSYEQHIKTAINHGITPVSETSSKWSRLRAGQTMNTRSGESVGPLLTTTWDQGQYYNSLCPEDVNGIAGHVPTGCVATAMAQIINYWQNPQNGRGTHSYYSNYGTLTVNYDSANYDYANMPDALSSSSTQEEVNAVAELIRDCGVAVNMGYSFTESSSYDVEARTALINFFRFSPNMSYAQKSHFSNAQWNNLLKENLSANRPILYSGTGDNGGHSFVCDGYNADNYYHFNFGWSGYADGWYLTTAINPSNYEYNSDQTAILGIVPDSTSNIILGQMMGTNTFTVEEPMEFYHLLGHNAFTGTDYSNSCNSTVVLVSADTTKPLALEVLSFENQNVTVYDSIFGNQLATFSSNSSSNSVFSTSSALTLVYQGSMKYTGFQLSVSQDNGCRMVSNVSSSVDTNTIHLSWHENGNATQWQVEYGLKGFSHGNGTIVIAEDTTIDISGLIKFKEYDMYIRSLCESNQTGPWCQTVTVMPEARYWTDVVTSQPEGYVEDSLGNVYISSAEGLAWFAKLSWEKAHDTDPGFFLGHTAVLTSDINLSQYNWKPIYYFCGVFDGQGHKIDSMYSISHEYGGYIPSLFGGITTAVLKDIILMDCYSKAFQHTAGGLVGSIVNSTVMNCFVSGRIEVPWNMGADIAPIAVRGSGNILNCMSNCRLLAGQGDAGGIVGVGGDKTKIRNCYSASTFERKGYRNGYVLGLGYNVTLENCYGYIARHGLSSNANVLYSTVRDNSWFNETDSGFCLIEPIYFETDSLYHSDLIEALNEGVKKINIEGLRLWVDDSTGINEGMPIFGAKYVVTCPNIQNLFARNVVNDNGVYGVELSWDEMGNADTWEIEYHVKDSSDIVRIMTINRPDTIWELIEHATYLFRVRPICGDADYGGWSEESVHIFDRCYWTEIVTIQPEGYNMDAEGNVTISSAEGLAWFASTVNGLNGQPANDFDGKTITLTQNIDIGQFKWLSVNNFYGTFDGNGNTISNLYVNELTSYQGFFGLVYGGKYLNINIENAYVKGGSQVGILIGEANRIEPYRMVDDLELVHKASTFATIINCHVSGTVYGEGNVGGIAGVVYGDEINYCSSEGSVYASGEAGGLFGYATFLRYIGGFNYVNANKSVRNCYSRCDVTVQEYTAGGLGYISSIENCCSIGTVTSGRYAGGLGSRIGTKSRNCYSAGVVPGEAYICQIICSYCTPFCEYSKGSLFGSGVDATISNCYGLSGQHPLIGTSVDGEPLLVSDTASFAIVNDSIMLLNNVAVGELYYDNLLDALNAWVDLYDTAGMFLHWVDDTTGINGGFPIFEAVRYNTVTLTVADSTPYGNVSGAGIYTNYEPTILSAIPNYGYHFVQWNDGNTDNPRTIKLIQDTTFSAIFEKNMYSVVGNAVIEVSYNFDFENPTNDSHWTLQNCDYINQWCINTLNDTNRALFISSDYGQSLSYTRSKSCVYAYTTIQLTPGMYNYGYSWFGGHGNCLVMLVPDSVELSNEIIENELPHSHYDYSIPLPSGAIKLDVFPFHTSNGSVGGWEHEDLEFGFSCGGGVYKLVVCWYNDELPYTSGNAAAFDNINIQFNSYLPEGEFDRGYVLGSDTVPYLDTVTLTAMPYEGYQFLKWHDGNTDNPRIVVADADKYYIALFGYARDVTLHVADSTPYGSVSGEGTYGNPETTPTATISATPDSGYHFVQWNDGNTDNPRTITLTQDTSFTAIFGIDHYSVVGVSKTGIDYSFDFENSAKDRYWILENKDYENRWYISQLNDTCRALYISGYDGYTNSYYKYSPSCVYAYTTIHLLPGQYNYNYDWRCNGYFWHFMRVILMPASYDFNDSLWMDYYTIPNYAYRLHKSYSFLNSDFEWRNISGNISINDGGDYKLFVQWYNDGEHYSGYSTSATIDNIHFYINPEGEVNQGYVLGSDTVPYLDTVLLTVVPYEGYRFLKWHDGNTENPRAVVASSDKYYIALFEEDCEPSVLADTSTICEDQRPYNWDGIVFSEGGIYSDTLVNASGCDSILTKVLIVNSSTVIIDDITACDSFTWIDGVTYTESTDEPIYTMTSMSGCDSVLSLHLTMYYSEYVDFFETANESYIWDNVTYTETGDYTITYSNIHGCDSMVTLHLTVYHSDTTILNMSVCQSDLPIVWNDSVFTNADTKTTIFLATTGADSVVIMTLIVTPVSYTEISHSVCGNELPFIWENMECPAPGDYTKTLTNTMECDSIITLHLTVNYPTYEDTTVVACESFIWHGETYSTSGNYSYYTTNSMGCDSVIMMYLIVGHSDSTTFSVTACDFYTWNDSVYTLSGDYTQNFQTVHGCDSVVTLHLTINHSTTGDTMAVACESFDWYEHTGITQSCENLTHTFTNAMGCDSVVTLHLTINNPMHTAVTENACESYMWNGTTYTVSGDYTYSHADANGCTQVDTLHLTINNPVHTAVTETACGSYTWNGTEYTVSGDYTYSHTDANGCTQVDTLHLTINNPVHIAVTETACETFTWNGTEYTVSGDYTYSHADANGCTQVDTLHLTIFNDETSEFTIVTEEPCYTWNNVEYCVSGDYTQTIQTVHGCDSIVTLHLTITVGLDDHETVDFKVYPNPTNGVVNVECTMNNVQLERTEVQVVDMYGKLVRIVETHGRASLQGTIDISDLANGVYFVKLIAEGKTIAVRKVVKQ